MLIYEMCYCSSRVVLFVLYFLFIIGRFCVLFFFKQKTAYEMRISDRSSDVCSSDLPRSSTNDALVVTSSSLTPSCSTTIFLTRSSMLLMDFAPDGEDRKSVV